MIKIEVKFTLGHFKVITNHFKFSLKRKISLMLAIIISALLTFVIFRQTGQIPFLFLILTILFIIITIGFYLISLMTNPERDYSTFQKQYPNSSISFIFDENKIITSQSSDSSCGKSEFTYDSIKSAEKIDNFFVIKLKQNSMIIFREDEIIEGSTSELVQIIKEKSGINLKM